MTNPWFRGLRIAFGVAAIGFLAAAFLRTVEEVEGSLLPPVWAVLVAGAAQAGALWATQRSWAALLPEVPARRLAQGFYVSHLGKYIPGAVWQPLGQVGYAVRDGVEMPRAAAGYLLHALVAVVAMALLGGLVLVAAPFAPSTLRRAALIGLALPIVLHRSWLTVLIRFGGRFLPVPDPARHLPSQIEILRSFGWASISGVCTSGSFAFVLGGLAGLEYVSASVPAYGLSWVVGFLALPVPAGIGVREAVLVGVMVPVVPVATILAASIYQRLISMVVEAGFVVGSSVARTKRRLSEGEI